MPIKKTLKKSPAQDSINESTAAATSLPEEDIGQLSVDVYESPEELTIIAPIAGVKLSDINISLTEDILTVSGKRKLDYQVSTGDYLIQECFWGEFSRSIVLPDNIDQSRISASFKDGILKISIPKTPGNNRTKLIRIKND
jgi:HSP20 family protein